MAILATTPVVIDSVEYPYYAISLVVSPQLKTADVTGSMVLRLQPYRVLPDNTIDLAPAENARNHIVSDIFQRAAQDQEFGSALQSIYAALANYISVKGL